jgi:predicted XRE-type DNA-binding protein
MEAKEIIDLLTGDGMTQERIAKATGIGQPTISKIVRGQVGDVSSRRYRALLSLLATHKDSKVVTAEANCN